MKNQESFNIVTLSGDYLSRINNESCTLEVREYLSFLDNTIYNDSTMLEEEDLIALAKEISNLCILAIQLCNAQMELNLASPLPVLGNTIVSEYSRAKSACSASYYAVISEIARKLTKYRRLGVDNGFYGDLSIAG